MDVNPYESPKAVDADLHDRPPRDQRSPDGGNLPFIMGVGAGAIGGACVSIVFYDDFPAGVFLIPFAGALIGAVAPSIWTSSGDARRRRDRFRLALTSLLAAALLASVFGLLLGGPLGVWSPFFRGCLILGLIVGIAVFVGLALSAVIRGRRDPE